MTPLHLVTDGREALNSFHFTVKLRRQEGEEGTHVGPSPKSVKPLNTHGAIKGGWENREQSKGPSRFQKAPSVMFSINSLLPDRSHPSIRKEFRNLSLPAGAANSPRLHPAMQSMESSWTPAACQSERSDTDGHHCLMHAGY